MFHTNILMKNIKLVKDCGLMETIKNEKRE